MLNLKYSGKLWRVSGIARLPPETKIRCADGETVVMDSMPVIFYVLTDEDVKLPDFDSLNEAYQLIHKLGDGERSLEWCDSVTQVRCRDMSDVEEYGSDSMVLLQDVHDQRNIRTIPVSCFE